MLPGWTLHGINDLRGCTTSLQHRLAVTIVRRLRLGGGEWKVLGHAAAVAASHVPSDQVSQPAKRI